MIDAPRLPLVPGPRHHLLTPHPAFGLPIKGKSKREGRDTGPTRGTVIYISPWDQRPRNVCQVGGPQTRPSIHTSTPPRIPNSWILPLTRPNPAHGSCIAAPLPLLSPFANTLFWGTIVSKKTPAETMKLGGLTGRGRLCDCAGWDFHRCPTYQVPSVLLRQHRRGEGQPVPERFGRSYERKCFLCQGLGPCCVLRRQSRGANADEWVRAGACECVRVRMHALRSAWKTIKPLQAI